MNSGNRRNGRFYSFLVIFFILVGCSVSYKRNNIPKGYLKNPEDTDNYIYSRGISDISINDAEIKARNNLICKLEAYINIYHVSERDSADIQKNKLMKEIRRTISGYLEVARSYESEKDEFYVLMKVKRSYFEKCLLMSFKTLETGRFVTYEDNEGNLIDVWVIQRDFPYESELILGNYLGVDPSNTVYFQVDVDPCEYGGIVSIPGKVIEVRDFNRKECKTGDEYLLYRIIYKPE